MADFERTKMDSKTLVAQYHVGPFEEASKAWDRLNNLVAMQRLVGESSLAIGISYDNPQTTLESRFRYDAAVVVDDATVKRARLANLSRKESRGLRMIQFRGGNFMRAIHYGPYSDLPATYGDLVHAAAVEGVELEELPLIQIYRNSPKFTDEKDLETELLVRIKGDGPGRKGA